MIDTPQLPVPLDTKVYTRFVDLLQKRGHSEKASEELALQIMLDLEDMYIQARTSGNISAAIKVKELQGKELGLFVAEKRSRNEGIPVKPLEKMNTEELEHLITSTCDSLGLNPDKLVETEQEGVN